MSIHIGAEKGAIAETVLLPGDPLRARYVAETFLKKPVCYNEVRAMYGYTGTYKGKRISVQGTGMGLPSLAIYAHELMAEYGVTTLIRIGSCGSMQENIAVRDLVLAMSACTDSAMNKVRFSGMDYAPTANFELLQKAFSVAKTMQLDPKVGPVLSTDTFYSDHPDSWKNWATFGVLVVEMESTALYTLAAKYKARALSILTVSDSLISGETTSAWERQTTFPQMVKLALESV